METKPVWAAWTRERGRNLAEDSEAEGQTETSAPNSCQSHFLSSSTVCGAASFVRQLERIKQNLYCHLVAGA